MDILRRLEQLRELSIVEWQVLLQSMLLLPLIALALKLKGLKWTRARISSRSKPDLSVPDDEQLEIARSVARMVYAAAHHGPYRTNCLKKSLATLWLLRRKGIAANLKIGVNKEVADFSAHAWLEYQGKVLVDPVDVGKRFSAFDSQSLYRK